tara:strand:+ start:203 stop:703 length:501 start_codon:yes stop_codon:yes gene_type:complete
VKTGTGFRAWFYFRMGWSTYFVFFLGATNTLTVTYFLAIDNYPVLKTVFPTFELYIMTTIFILVPSLILVGYSHYKKTKAFTSELDVLIESNPFLRRNTVNSEILLRFNVKLTSMLLKISQKETIDKKELEEIEKMQKDMIDLFEKRTLTNKFDIDFVNSELRKSE